MSSDPDPPKSPEDGAVPAPVDAELAAAAARPEASGSIEIAVSDSRLPPAKSSASGSIDVSLSLPNAPKLDDAAPIEDASPYDSAPVSSGRVTSMQGAVTGPTEAARGKTIADAGKEMLGKGVETIGTGLETIGEGVTKLAEVSKKVPLVGSSVARLGEGITSVGESITELPRVARTRRGRLLVRSLVVGFVLVFLWIAAIALLQRQRIDSPDFRPHAERILTQISAGRASIEALYESASPRFQEMVRKDRFVETMLDLNASAGAFTEITAVNESFVTRGPTGRVGRISFTVNYAKGWTRGSLSLHWIDNQWKLLGVGIELPADVKITEAEREQRVAACKDPMDTKRCDLHVAANRVLEALRDGKAAEVWDQASDVFQGQEQKGRWVQIITEQQTVLGEYRRIIAVTEAKILGGTRGSFDVLVEYSKANVRATFGFMRAGTDDPWKLRSLKIVLPMPRIDDVLEAGSGSAKR